MPDTDLTDIRELLASAPLTDGHNDLLWEAREKVAYDFDRLDVAGSVPSLQTDIPRLRLGGVGAQFWSVYVPSNLEGDRAVTMVLEQLDAWHALCSRYSTDLAQAFTADDVDKAVADGRIASLAGMEGGQSIGASLGALRMLYALGARYLTLTHNDNNAWADSATDTPVHDGLSAFGEEVVREMNRLGMLVDLSHVAPATMHDALRASAAPVIFSHSSAKALCDHPRNVPDDVLTKLRANGGVCMVTMVPGFVVQRIADHWKRLDVEEKRLTAELGADAADEVKSRLEEWDVTESVGIAPASETDVADHIEHVRDVAGIEHVGFGGDYDGVPVMPAGLEDVSTYPVLFGELRSRGWSDDDLRACAGRNVLRVLREAEDVARAEQQRRGPSLVRIEDLSA